MSKFAHAHLQGLQGLIDKETLDTISIVFGGLFGAATITHFAATFLSVAQDNICLCKRDENKVHYLARKVNIPIFLLNLFACILIMGFDGYVSLVGIKEAVANIGTELAATKYTAETQRAESGYSAETAKDWQSWRTDSANIETLYASKIKTAKSAAQGEIQELRGKAARGAATGAGSWAASLRGAAQSKEARLGSVVEGIEAEKAQKLLDRSKQRDDDVRQKNGEKSSKLGVSIKDKEGTENVYKGYASGTWIISLLAYILYMVLVVKRELIHIESGIENEVQVQEGYFRTSFAENLKHELGEWAHDIGRIFTNKLAEWRQGLRKRPIFKNLPNDAGDAYSQQVRYSATDSNVILLPRAMQEDLESEGVPEPYRQTGKIGFPPLTPPPLAQSIQEKILPDGRIELTTNFDTVPPFVKVFEDRAGAEEWKRHIHPAVPMREKVLSSSLQRELAEMKTSPQAPPPPPPPKITEVAAPCENIGKIFEISTPRIEISKSEIEISKKRGLPFTLIGMSKVESQMKFRQKTGSVRLKTYQKNMERVQGAKEIMKAQMGQYEMIL